MNIKKSVIVAGTAATVGLAGVAGLNVVSAAPNVPELFRSGKPAYQVEDRSGEIEGAAQSSSGKNVRGKEAPGAPDVTQQVTEYLSELVAQGKITEKQKDKLVAKHAEFNAQLAADLASWKDKPKNEIHVLMQEREAELTLWSEQNGIPSEYAHMAVQPHKAPMGSATPHMEVNAY